MGKVNHPTTMIDRILALESEVKSLRKRAGLGNSSISDGDITLQGGTLRVRNQDGTYVAKIGYLGIIAGNPIYGAQFYRPDGTEAIIIYGDATGFAQYIGYKDKAGHLIFSDDDNSGQGLSMPWLSYSNPMPLQTSLWPATTNTGAFDPVAQTTAFVSHSAIYVVAEFFGNGGTGNGRVTVNGTQVGSTVVINNGSITSVVVNSVQIPGWGTTVNFMDLININIEAKADSALHSVAGHAKIVAGV